MRLLCYKQLNVMPKEIGSSYPRRRDFERGANLLRESIENQRIFFPSDARLMDSIGRVRLLPNGRLNLDTVDELVRSNFHILAANPWKNHETEK